MAARAPKRQSVQPMDSPEVKVLKVPIDVSHPARRIARRGGRCGRDFRPFTLRRHVLYRR